MLKRSQSLCMFILPFYLWRCLYELGHSMATSQFKIFLGRQNGANCYIEERFAVRGVCGLRSYWHVYGAWLQAGFGITEHLLIVIASNYSAVASSHALKFTRTNYLVFSCCVITSRCLVTELLLTCSHCDRLVTVAQVTTLLTTVSRLSWINFRFRLFCGR